LKQPRHIAGFDGFRPAPAARWYAASGDAIVRAP
jgi:hypothetical protein